MIKDIIMLMVGQGNEGLFGRMLRGLSLNEEELRRGELRLKEIYREIEKFEDSKVDPIEHSGWVRDLSSNIEDCISLTFVQDSPEWQKYIAAKEIIPSGHKGELEKFWEQWRASKRLLERAIILLVKERVVRQKEVKRVDRSASASRKVFIVHGHDGEARETLARYLMKLDFEPIILHEQANQGRTIIEKVEDNSDVGFAVVLLTPDDEGCKMGEAPEPRARQNVLLELGYFIGKLGREKVCAFQRGKVSIPNDFAGVVWTNMDDANGWKQELTRELRAAGYEIDWNKAMA